MEADDSAIIARILDGDAESFAELVRRYQVGLYRYAVSMIGDPDTAADMVQDALIRAYTNLASCREPDRFRVWLFRTLRNRCFDHLKDPRRRQVSIEDVPPVPDGHEGPGERAERASLRVELLHALDRLPPVQREAFLMHYVEGHSYEEMADMLTASVSALKMRVLRAREAMAAQLRDHDVTSQPGRRLSIRRGR
jgi:RNA polymerase sigma-70 factor (ECF subfamily)